MQGNGFNDAQISYRVGSLAMNAVKAMREVYGRDGQSYLDADSAAVKAIEAILHDLPAQSEYPDLESRQVVSKVQPEVNPALDKVRGMLADELNKSPGLIKSYP